MSEEYLKTHGTKKITREQMRKLCQRPGTTDDNGEPIYTTEQHHKDSCDINNIIKKYDTTGLITHISRFEAKFGDLTGMDFKQAMDITTKAKQQFDQLPANIRSRFENNPELLLSFMEKPENRKEAIDLGLIRADWTEESDGLGEHIKEGENVKETQAKPAEKTVEQTTVK